MEAINFRSPLKWVGGKSQIIGNVVEALMATKPNGRFTYIEPFLGGGTVLLSVLATFKENGEKPKFIASDINPKVINFFRAVKDSSKELVAQASRLFDEAKNAKNLKEFYYEARSRFNSKSVVGVEEASLFLFLNKFGFRGIYRENKDGGFNVPFGHPSTIPETPTDAIFEASRLLNWGDVTLSTCSFEEALSLGDESGQFLIYADPPYVPTKATSFVAYASDGFSKEKHAELFKILTKLRQNGAGVVISNSNSPLVIEAFAGWTIDRIMCRRAINSRNPADTAVELLISSPN
jgi:DNA adenine methylase